MDLNVQPPATWTVEGPYEIAEHCVKTGTNTLILLNAWLFSGEDKDDSPDSRDWSTLNYWAMRLRPLWSRDGNTSGIDVDKETTVILCNRCGEENGQ